MPKPNPLTQGLRREPAATTERKAAVPASRVGRVLIAGHFAPEVQIALKILAAEKRTSIQALLAEGIDMVFARYHKPEIASLSSSREN